MSANQHNLKWQVCVICHVRHGDWPMAAWVSGRGGSSGGLGRIPAGGCRDGNQFVVQMVGEVLFKDGANVFILGCTLSQLHNLC